MPTAMRKDPYGNFNFRVEIAGIIHAGFSEVSGLQAEVEVEDYREGGVNDYIHRLAGPTRYPNNLVLKRGMIDTDELWQWQAKVLQRDIERKDIALVLCDVAGTEVHRWMVRGAYPVRWVGPELRANAAEVAFEALEFVHRGIEKQ